MLDLADLEIPDTYTEALHGQVYVPVPRTNTFS